MGEIEFREELLKRLSAISWQLKMLNKNIEFGLKKGAE